MDVYWVLYTLFAFCVGPPLALFGYRYFKPLFAIVGFLCGFALAVGVVSSIAANNPAIATIGGVFGGLAGLLIANVCAFFLIHVLGFQVGSLVIGVPLMLVFQALGIEHMLFLTFVYIVAVLAGLIGGTYASTGRRVVVIAWSSLTGAIFVCFGLMMVLYFSSHAKWPGSLGGLLEFANHFSVQHLFVYIIGILLFVDAMRYQFRSTKGLPELDLANPFGVSVPNASPNRRTRTRRF